VVLPSGANSFVESSVRPFGEEWVTRFNACMKAAKSVKTMSLSRQATDQDLYLIAGDVAMGQAILKGQQFDVTPSQVLLHDERIKNSMTSLHAAKWLDAGLTQIMLPVSIMSSKKNNEEREMPKSLDIVMGVTGSAETQTFSKLKDAIEASRLHFAQSDQRTIALVYANDDVDERLGALTEKVRN